MNKRKPDNTSGSGFTMTIDGSMHESQLLTQRFQQDTATIYLM